MTSGGKHKFKSSHGSSNGASKRSNSNSVARFKSRKKANGEMLYRNLDDDDTQISLLNKIDSKPKDVSFLERPNYKKQKQQQESDQVDDATLDGFEPMDHVSSYENLLHSFRFKDVTEARRAIKKRKPDIDEETVSSKKAKLSEYTSTKTHKTISNHIIKQLSEDESDSEEEDELSNQNDVGEEEDDDDTSPDEADTDNDDKEIDVQDKMRHLLRLRRLEGSEEDPHSSGESEEEDIPNSDQNSYTIHYNKVYSNEEAESFQKTSSSQWSQQNEDSLVALNLNASISTDHRAGASLRIQSPNSRGIKRKIIYSWNLAYPEIFEGKDTRKKSESDAQVPSDQIPKMSPHQETLFSLINSYYDVFYGLRGPLNGLPIMATYTLHVANHISNALDQVKQSNSTISVLAAQRRKIKTEITLIKDSLNKKPDSNHQADETKDEKKPKLSNAVPGEEHDGIEIPDDPTLWPIPKRMERLKDLHSKLREENDQEFRDQGFTRPKVLVLLPTKNSALEFVELLIKFLPRSTVSNVENRRKFYADYFDEVYAPRGNRPIDWFATFKGNRDDQFKLGISFRGKSMKLYSSFYKSDIIVASPLGLRLAANEEEQGATDYLSSIELVIVDQADVILMQNWDHLKFIFDKLSKIPEKPRDTDFSRVRNYFLNQQAPFFRQTLIFSSVLNVDINSLFNRACLNATGKIKVLPKHEEGSIGNVFAPSSSLRQIFYRLQPPDVHSIDDFRFNYFKSNVFEHLKDSGSDGVLIVIPSYFDYVRLREFFKEAVETEAFSVVAVSEYTTETRGIKYRKHFYTKRAQIMLITERYHFYTRIKIRGVKSIIFYSPPLFANLYSELANWVEEGGSVLTLYTNVDGMLMEGIVGNEKWNLMKQSEKSTHSISS